MVINSVIDYLNKQLGYEINGDYYKYISEWRDWWKGFYKPFHQFKERSGDKIIERDLYTMKMAKKICEDWAAILLNEKTHIVVDDDASSKFLQGEDETGGVLGENHFWTRANALVEKAFYSGTGAIVAHINGMLIQDDHVVKDEKAKIVLEYIPAMNIIPLTVRQGKIVDVAFASELMVKGKKQIYLETHILENRGYTITNQYFTEEDGGLIPQEYEGIISSYTTGTNIPMFAIITPNIVNNIDDSTGLGISVFANAIDNLKGVDLAYNNFCRDFKLGGKKVFINKELTDRDINGNLITPDDVAQQLFLQTGDENLSNDRDMIHEFNPSLRVAENKDGIQAQLDYLSFKCGLGTKHYQFNISTGPVTATQYMGDKQELVQNASKHYIIIEKALQDITRAILWIGKEICGQPINPDAKITVTFDDSYIIDKESERLRDLQEMRDGILQKYEYRMKWYGEDEATAKKMVGADRTDDEIMEFGGI